MLSESPKAPPVDLDEIASQVAAATGQPASAADLERIMSSLQAVSSFWEAVALSGRTVTQVAAGLRALAAVDVVTFEAGKAALTPGGLALAWQRGLTPRKLYRCPQCEGRGLALTIFQRAQARYERALAEWRAADGSDAAGPAAVPAAVFALAAFLADRGDLMGKDILVEGDAALTGMALALSGFPRQTAILEPHRARARFLRALTERERIKLDVVDAATGIAGGELAGRFSTAVVPDLGAAGCGAAPALSGPGAALIGLWDHAAHPLTALAQLEADAARRGLVLTDLLRDFSAYAPSAHPHHPDDDDPDVLRQPPTAVWDRPALVRFERLP